MTRQHVLRKSDYGWVCSENDWTPALGESVYRSFNQHLLDVRQADDAPLEEGDEAYLKVKVFRANSEQALIEFVSKDEDPFSVRVPMSELLRR